MESFLLLTQNWEGYSFGNRLQQEGYVVKAYVKPEGNVSGPLGNKIQVIRNPFQLIEQFDCILCDTPHMSQIAESCIDKGIRTVGGCALSLRLLDDKFNRAVMQLLYTVRPEGYYTGWFSNGEFRKGCVIQSVNHDRLMDGNLGPKVETAGCYSTVVDSDSDSDVFNERVVELLLKAKYQGPVTVSEDGIKLHVDPIVTHSYFELVKDLGRFLLYSETLRHDSAMSLRLSVPPYPYAESGSPLRNELSKEALRHVHPTQSYCTVSGRGQTLNEARRRVYRAVDLLDLPEDVQYRLDIGKE